MRLGTLFALVACLIVAYCASVKWEDASRRSESPGAWPVLFVSEDEFLVQTKTELVLWRSNELKSLNAVFEIPKDPDGKLVFVQSGCFGTDHWILRTKMETEEGSKGGPSFFVQVSERNIVDVDTVESVRLEPKINRIDCDRIEVSGQSKMIVKNPRFGHADLEAWEQPTIFSIGHAQNVHTAADFGALVIEYKKEGKTYRQTFEGEWHRDFSRPKVVNEVNTPIYWLQDRRASSDGGNPDNWPRATWRFDIEANEVEQFELPAGPWVGDHDERLACFSCGCGCYREVNFVSAGDTLVAHVSGIGFPSKVQGIYALSYREKPNEWRRMFKGVVSSRPIASPSGCKLVFNAPQIKQLDLCS